MKYGVRSLFARTQSPKSSLSRFICLKLWDICNTTWTQCFSTYFVHLWKPTILSFVLFFFFFFYVFHVFLEIMKTAVRYVNYVERSLQYFYVFSSFPFGFEGRIWDLIVSVPGLSFYFWSLKWQEMYKICCHNNKGYPLWSALKILILGKY